MKRIIFLYAALIVVLIIFSIFKFGNISLFPQNNKPYAVIDGKKFDLLLATTEDQKIKGLTIKDKIDINQGMLFIFQEKNYPPFWMKNMKFPIDIIFINDDKIVDIVENATPPKNPNDISSIPIYRPKEKANYVLEINAGLSKKYNFKIGDKVTFSNIKL